MSLISGTETESGYFDKSLETYVEVKSDIVPFEQRPAMKCAEITDKVIAAVQGGQYRMIKLNFPMAIWWPYWCVPGGTGIGGMHDLQIGA